LLEKPLRLDTRLDALDAAMGARLERYAGTAKDSGEFQRVMRRK